MAAEHGQGRPRVHIPDPDRAIRRHGDQTRRVTAGRQPAAARRERQRGHGPSVAVQDRDVLSTNRLPHADGAVGARRGDPSPVRTVHGCGHVAGVAVVRRLDLAARRDGPLAHRPVGGG